MGSKEIEDGEIFDDTTTRAGNMGLARWAGPFSCKPEEGRACCFGGKRGERACRAGPLGPRACAGRAAGRPVRPASSFIKKKKLFHLTSGFTFSSLRFIFEDFVIYFDFQIMRITISVTVYVVMFSLIRLCYDL